MNKFDSTLLPQTNDKEEIQKGNLDLLAKINATILFMQEGIVTFAQEILKVLSTYIFPASRVSFAPGNSGLSATEVQTMGTELASPINTKATVADADTVTGNDSADGGKVKKWTWTTVKTFLKMWLDSATLTTVITNTSGIKFNTKILTGTVNASGDDTIVATGVTGTFYVYSCWIGSYSQGYVYDPGYLYSIARVSQDVYLRNVVATGNLLRGQTYRLLIMYEV